ncbi:MAG: ABC transporter ATP-binding protein [Acidobacteria bacterium]|nr:ABC transporter ATP-binding protein [Acidobacteriota bacterium]
MSQYAIQTEELSKVFYHRWSGREVRAVDGISLTVRRGTTFGLLGPNGAGKTTFVKMLLSATHPTAGRARIFGRDVSDPEARGPVGYLPENHRFPTYFTGEGMLDFYAALSGVSAARRRQLIPELLESVGLDRWGGVRLGKYSKGMLQRVGLAQALIHAPELLILDEPSDGVDPVGRRQIRDILQQLESRGTTIFINSHLLVEVELFCREVAIINRGRLALTGEVRQLTAGKGYRLAAVSPADALREELTRRAQSVAGFNGSAEFLFATREDLNAAIDIIRQSGCEVESVTPTTNTLEDVFMQTVGAAANAKAGQEGKA